MNRKFITVILLCSSFMLLHAEAPNQKLNSNQKLVDLFSLLRNNSSTYKNYRLVKEDWIVNFQSSLGNYLEQEKAQKNAALTQLKTKDSKINILQNEIAALQNTNIDLAANNNSINFLGITFSKNAFTTLIGFLILGLMLLVGFLFVRFKRANAITSSSKLILQELEDEYESFRRVSIEREQALKRNFFDEMKKIEKLKSAS